MAQRKEEFKDISLDKALQDAKVVQEGKFLEEVANLVEKETAGLTVVLNDPEIEFRKKFEVQFQEAISKEIKAVISEGKDVKIEESTHGLKEKDKTEVLIKKANDFDKENYKSSYAYDLYMAAHTSQSQEHQRLLKDNFVAKAFQRVMDKTNPDAIEKLKKEAIEDVKATIGNLGSV